MRCFVAIYPIEDRTTQKIETVKDGIKKFIVGKAVEKENMHITLSFLGEVNERELENIKKNIKESVKEIKKRYVKVGRIKLIPNENFIRVIALDVTGLEDISQKIKENVGGDVKPPHITLFRVKKLTTTKDEIVKYCKNVDIGESFEVKDIKLMRSILTKNGPIYEIVETFLLLQ